MRRGGYLSLGLKDIFDPKGRIDRLTFFMYGIILTLMTYGLGAILYVIFGVFEAYLPQVLLDFQEPVVLLLLLPIYYGRFCIAAKRLHDLNMPSAIGLLLFTDDILNVILTTALAFGFISEESLGSLSTVFLVIVAAVVILYLVLLFMPGKRGPNKYGLSSTGDDLPRPHVLDG